MTLEMGMLFAVLAGMAVLFFTEKLSVELTAFIGLVFLILFGYIDPSEAFSGFASPAVITMLSIFFVSAALLHTGVADVIAGKVHKVIGNNEVLLIIALMVVAGVLSAFMNNIAAVAVLLPAVAGICKKTKIAPSRLFIPLSFGAILGGTTTLVGTPPNILAADLLAKKGLETFSLFDFMPMGLILLGTGILYMITIGRLLLPNKVISKSAGRTEDLTSIYHLQESLFSIRVQKNSKLDGITLEQAKLRHTLGVQVVGIIRDGKKELAPGPDTRLKGDDLLLVEGSYDKLKEMFQVQGVELGNPDTDDLADALNQVRCISAQIKTESSFVGKTLRDVHFREQFGAVVVGIRRGDKLIDNDLPAVEFKPGDALIAMGTKEQLDMISAPNDLDIIQKEITGFGELKSHLFLLSIHAGSPLAGRTIQKSKISELVGLTVAGIIRRKKSLIVAKPREKIKAGDQLLVAGEADRIRHLVSLGDVQLQQEITRTGIQSEDVGIVEVTLSPRSHAAGKTLVQTRFRENTGLQVVAIWTKGRVLNANLASQKLKVGDALLVQGSWNRIRALGTNPDFVVLTPSAQEPRRTRKAPIAIGALAIMIAMVMSGFMPIHVAAFTAATLVALFGAVTMEEAYRAVEWKAVFLVAAILPVGIAIERTGAAALASNAVTSLTGPFGPHGVLAGLVVLASTLSQSLDGAPAVVLMAPIVLPAAEQMGINTQSVMMAVALAASAAFMTPFSHKANLLVMGAGGYKVTDYLKVGTPLTIVLLILMVFLTPIFFPF